MALSFILALLSIELTECQYQNGMPILWQPFDTPVVDAVISIHHEIAYVSPCPLMRNISSIPALARDNLADWCDHQFQDSFINEIHRFCKSYNPSLATNKWSLVRHKRFEPISMMVIGTVAAVSTGVASLVSLGLGTYSTYKSGVNTEDIKKMRKDLDNLRKNSHVMRDTLVEYAKQFFELNNTVHHFMGVQFSQTLTFIADLSSRYQHIQQVLMKAGGEWNRKGVNPDLFTSVFNISHPDDYEFDLAEAGKCILDETNQFITMEFKIPRRDKNAKLMYADTFKLADVATNKSICTMEYVGPTIAIVDTDSGCIKPRYNDDNIRPKTIIYNNNVPCEKNVNSTYTKYWKHTECLENVWESNIYGHLQIKYSKNANFLYCPGMNLTIHENSQPCPAYVFVLPVETNFSVGNWNYTFNSFRDVHVMEFVESINLRINNFLMPDLHDLNNNVNDYESIKRQLDKLRALKDYPDDDKKHLKLGFGAGLIVMLLTIILVYCLSFRKIICPPSQGWLILSGRRQEAKDIRKAQKASKVNRKSRPPTPSLRLDEKDPEVRIPLTETRTRSSMDAHKILVWNQMFPDDAITPEEHNPAPKPSVVRNLIQTVATVEPTPEEQAETSFMEATIEPPPALQPAVETPAKMVKVSKK